MQKTHIYPIAFAPVLFLLLSCFCFYVVTLVGGFSIAMLPLLLAGGATLCYSLYIFPIITFDNRQITILRLFPCRPMHIPWTEVQYISPLESGNFLTTAGYVCDIHTVRKTYSVFPLSLGFYKLLKHWDAIKSNEERPSLLIEKIPVKKLQEPFFKNPGFYLLLLIIGLSIWLASTPTGNGLPPAAIFLGFPLLFILLTLLLAGPYFNYFEFTSTHFYVRSPFFFWRYAARWEDIRAIRLVSTSKNKLVIICNKEYRYKFIIMGDLPPYEVISQLQKANVPIGMA